MLVGSLCEDFFWSDSGMLDGTSSKKYTRGSSLAKWMQELSPPRAKTPSACSRPSKDGYRWNNLSLGGRCDTECHTRLPKNSSSPSTFWTALVVLRTLNHLKQLPFSRKASYLPTSNMTVKGRCQAGNHSHYCHRSTIIGLAVFAAFMAILLLGLLYYYGRRCCYCSLNSPCVLVNSLCDRTKRAWRQKVSRNERDVPLDSFGGDLESNRHGQ